MRYVVDKSYLHQRGAVWWYNRRIPTKYTHVDTRSRIRISLETASFDEASILRDRLVEAAQVRYQSAKTRALSAGFSYRPLDVLLDENNVEDVIDRLLVIRERSGATLATQSSAG